MSRSNDASGQLLDPSCPTLERTFRGHRGSVAGVSFSPTMQQLASVSADMSVMVWNFKPSMRAYRYIGHKAAVNAVSFSPTGEILASASTDKTVKLWVPTVQGESTTIKGHSGAVRALSFAPDGRKLLTAADDKVLKLWSVATHRFITTLSGHTSWVRACGVSPDGRVAASGADDKQVKLWDLEKRNCLATFYDHRASVSSVAFHPDGTCLAAASHDSTIKIWDLRMNRELLQHYNAHDDQVNSISFHPSGDWLISSSNDSTVKVWDIKEGYLSYVVNSHAHGVSAASFSPNGEFFSTGGSDNMVMVWKSNFDRNERNTTLQTSLSKPASAPPPATRRAPLGDHTNQSLPSKISHSKFRGASPKRETTTTTTTTTAPAETREETFETPAYDAPSLPVGMGEAEVSQRLEHVFRQLDILTGTMQRFQERVGLTEDRSMQNETLLLKVVNTQESLQDEVRGLAHAVVESNKRNEAAVTLMAGEMKKLWGAVKTAGEEQQLPSVRAPQQITIERHVTEVRETTKQNNQTTYEEHPPVHVSEQERLDPHHSEGHGIHDIHEVHNVHHHDDYEAEHETLEAAPSALDTNDQALLEERLRFLRQEEEALLASREMGE